MRGGELLFSSGMRKLVAFAIDPGRTATAYALTDAEVRPVLAAAQGRHDAMDTGRCLVE